MIKNGKTSAQAVIDTSWQVMLVVAVVAAVGMMPMEALAGGKTIGKMLCTVNDWFTGPLGQGLATLALVVIGVGALMGKVGWGMAIIVGVGIAIIFGAAALVTELNAGKGGCGM